MVLAVLAAGVGGGAGAQPKLPKPPKPSDPRLLAPERGRSRDRGDDDVPAAYRPPPGMCRIWLDNVAPAQQPAPTDCNSAVRNRPANARILFGDDYARRDRDGVDASPSPARPGGAVEYAGLGAAAPAVRWAAGARWAGGPPGERPTAPTPATRATTRPRPRRRPSTFSGRARRTETTRGQTRPPGAAPRPPAAGRPSGRRSGRPPPGSRPRRRGAGSGRGRLGGR
jgi:hypothetical protein